MIRNPYFDNVKFILVALVVIGHILDYFIDYSPFLKAAWVYLAMFRMPAFALVAGYFAKNILLYDRRKLLLKWFVYYLVFQVVYYGLFAPDYLTAKQILFIPFSVMWFLMALILWYVMLPMFSFKYSLPMAVIIALCAGYTNIINYCEPFRIVTLFPFFLCGHLAKKHNLTLPKINTFIPWLILISGMFLAYYISPWFAANQIQAVPVGAYNLLFRCGLFLTAAVMIYCILSVIPKDSKWYTALGTKTLYIYLLHGIIINITVSNWL